VITATPAPGYRVNSWGNATSIGVNQAEVYMTSNKTVTAYLVQEQYTLAAVASGGNATFDYDPPGPTYTYGTSVTITASPQTGYRVDHWDGAASAGENKASVQMVSNTAVTAYLVPIKYTLTVTADPAGSGTVSKDPGPDESPDKYNYGRQVGLTASGDSSHVFTEWQGGLTGSTNPDTVTMDSDKAVTAKFDPVTVDLSVEDNITQCMEGRYVTYTATASSNFPTPSMFTFNYRRADGTYWQAEEWSSDNIEDNTPNADYVLDGDADHKFSTPIMVEADGGGKHAESSTMWIEVYELWIEYFRHAATQKPWKVVVGESIEYSAIASSDCVNWQWYMTDGFTDMWNPTGGNAKTGAGMVIPYSDMPEASGWSYFGDTYGTVYVSCEDGDGNNHHFYSTSMTPPCKAYLYFDPQLTVDGTVPNSSNTPPCWYVYWRGGAVPDLDQFEYVHVANSYGASDVVPGWLWNTYVLQVHSLAGGTHYPGGMNINGINFSGATGIDCCTEVVKHEMRHNVLVGQVLGGEPDADPIAVVGQDVGDLLPDSQEAALGCNPQNQDTFNLAVIKAPGYIDYGDGEYAVMVHALGSQGDPSKDWSKGGKQW
jgi:hypothetical protein